tara:strand:+ start:3020 stop:3625 length:606 start_codon:yes stop_codon:yes gene_type:complete
MNWKQLVDRCGLFVDANSRLLLNLLYEAEEELTKECLIYEDEFTKTLASESSYVYLPDIDSEDTSLNGSSFVAPIQVIVNGNKIKAMHEDEFYYQNDGSLHKGSPSGYSIKNKTINFSHILKASDVVKVLYYGMVRDHTDISPKIPTIYHRELCNYACYMSQIKDSPDVASVFANLWVQSLEKVKNSEGNRDMVYSVREEI